MPVFDFPQEVANDDVVSCGDLVAGELACLDVAVLLQEAHDALDVLKDRAVRVRAPIHPGKPLLRHPLNDPRKLASVTERGAERLPFRNVELALDPLKELGVSPLVEVDGQVVALNFVRRWLDSMAELGVPVSTRKR